MTVVELPGFIRDAATTMTESERIEMVSFLAANPEAGDIMAGTGGARKLRWKSQGKGKNGDAIKSLLPRLVAGFERRMRQ
jgi:hypothetical protein